MLKPYWFMTFLASMSLQAITAHADAYGLPAKLATQKPLTVRVNGLAMEVRSALVDSPPESLADAILEAWRDAGHAGLRFQTDPERTVLGRQRGPVHETVTLLPAEDPRTTTVVHASNDSRQTPSSVPAPPFTLPRGLKVMRTIEQVSRSRPEITFKISSELQPRETVERLRAALLDARWILTSRVTGIESSSILSAVRAKQEMTIIVADRDGETRVTLEITGHAP